MRRPAVPAPLLACLAALACAAEEPTPCPGTAVATFRFKGPLVAATDPDVFPVDPASGIPDCTPDPWDETAPVRYPPLLPPFVATLAGDPDAGTAALCRPNGIVYSGLRTGPSSYEVEASAQAAALCEASCAATLKVVVAGEVERDPGGGDPVAFRGLLVEVLTASRGTCDACLPLVPGADPPVRACAGRYSLSGTPQ